MRYFSSFIVYIMDHNFADNKYIRKAIKLKTAENKKYRAKRIKYGCVKNNKKQNYSLLDDYVDDYADDYVDDYVEFETPIDTIQYIIIDEYVVL